MYSIIFVILIQYSIFKKTQFFIKRIFHKTYIIVIPFLSKYWF